MTTVNVTAVPAATFPEAAAIVDKLDLIELDNRVTQLREMMLIGLAAFGEVERLTDKLALFKHCNVSLPADLRVIHPTSHAETVSDFADALRCLDSMIWEVTRIAELARDKHPNVAASPKPEKNTALDAFGHEVCQRVGAVGCVIDAGLELLRKDDLDQEHMQFFRAGEVFASAKRLLDELSFEAIDAEVTMAKRAGGAV